MKSRITFDQEPVTFEQIPKFVYDNNQRLERIENSLNHLQAPVEIKPDKKYTLPEAADYCRMAIPTFRTYLARREVSGTKFGKAWVFSQENLDLFFQKYRVKTIDELNIVASDSLIIKRK